MWTTTTTTSLGRGDGDVDELVRMIRPDAATATATATATAVSPVRQECWGGRMNRVIVERQPPGSSVEVWYGGRRKWTVVVVKDPCGATRVYTSVRLAMAGLAADEGENTGVAFSRRPPPF